MADQPAAGPLAVSETNPRYFSAPAHDGGRKIVYLTGSHVNNNFHDGMGFGKERPEQPERFDYPGYLEFLRSHGHNFIRLWRWEQFQGYLTGADVHFFMSPQPWPRTGPGTAKDGRPRFDLDEFDPDYFDRLHERVLAAADQGIYVSVMFFEGFSLHLTATPDNIEGHPFHSANNVNDIGISSIVDYQVLPLDAGIRRVQEAYVRKMVDTLHDLPNVLYEVANESSGLAADNVTLPDGSTMDTRIGDSTEWQYWVIRSIKEYEKQRGYQPHPVGMTFLYPVPDQSRANQPLWDSPAEWISPGFDEGSMPVGSRWLTDPPASDGTKVVISDTDHYSPMSSDALWAWKSFLRGHNPILYDLGIFTGVDPPDATAGAPSYESLESARQAMGDTRRLAGELDLAAMAPHGELCSTGFALADTGREYVVLQPEEGEGFTVALPAGTYARTWHDVTSRETASQEPVTVTGSDTTEFGPPFDQAGPVVLHLRAV